MDRFKFKLQRLLDIRETKEVEIKNELSAVVGRQNVERARQEQLRGRMSELTGRLRAEWVDGRIDSTSVILYARFEEQAIRAIEASDKKIAAIQPEVDAIRERLIEASKEKKIVEKLKERRQKEYDIWLNRQIIKENDDINQKIHARRMRGNIFQEV
ncbi:MAG: flagellar export protein FliJ [Leptospirales bacterium]|nr:flagellar export protein FliJ [Leptospirales bacterium]